MDGALRRLHREALADPTDGARRAAYGRALLQQGRRTAAANELSAAILLGGEVSGQVPVEARRLRGGRREVWTIELFSVQADVVARPDLPDTRCPRAALRPAYGGDAVPIPLVPLPRCPDCLAACVRCQGTGYDQGKPCPCVLRPVSSCGVCLEGLAPLRAQRRPTCPGCATGRFPDEFASEHSGSWPVLVRCPACGLAALRCRAPLGSFQVTDVFPACPACGLLACDGDCAAVAW